MFVRLRELLDESMLVLPVTCRFEVGGRDFGERSHFESLACSKPCRLECCWQWGVVPSGHNRLLQMTSLPALLYAFIFSIAGVVLLVVLGDRCGMTPSSPECAS